MILNNLLNQFFTPRCQASQHNREIEIRLVSIFGFVKSPGTSVSGCSYYCACAFFQSQSLGEGFTTTSSPRLLLKVKLAWLVICSLFLASFAFANPPANPITLNPVSLATSSSAPLTAASGAQNFSYRAKFKDVRSRIQSGDISGAKRQAKQIEDYVLYPYIEYYLLNRRLNQASTREVMAFLEAHQDLPVAGILKRRWLKNVGANRQWRTFQDNFETSTDPTLNCYSLRALYGLGNKEQALKLATALWLQPKSQPKACDPLFDVWRTSTHFNEEIAWQRLHAAVTANERSLSRYLIRYLSGTNRAYAQALYDVHVAPNKIRQTTKYKSGDAKNLQVIAQGLRRLARRDADAAHEAWLKFQKSHTFSEPQYIYINEYIAAERAKKGTFPARENRIFVQNVDTIEDIAQAAMRQQVWPEVITWINKLPDDVKNKSQWRYWLARALQAVPSPTKVATPLPAASASASSNTTPTTLDHQPKDDSVDNESLRILQSLAQERHYYGFLAARQLGLPGQMNAAERNFNDNDFTQVSRIKGFARAIELFAVGDDLNGRREWYAGLAAHEEPLKIAAAEVAHELGLINLAIQSANIAQARDHLHLRFPLAHEAEFRQGSLSSALPSAFLFAVARQESAMQTNARSSANARGLMQLLPSTAKLVARRAKRRIPSANDLNDPKTNIALGSYHLGWLMQRYDQQSPLAIAAYNAGEHRVDRWIKQANDLPMDIWIERIPFHETRNYVKNVLAFRFVYNQILNTPAPLLGADEEIVRE